MALNSLQKEDPNNSTGNAGLQDQTAALRWVRDNIGGALAVQPLCSQSKLLLALTRYDELLVSFVSAVSLIFARALLPP